MDVLKDLILLFSLPIRYPSLPNQRIFWVYLLCALVIAAVVYFVHCQARGKPVRVGGLLRFWFPKNVFTHASAIVDYKYFLINRILFPLFFAPFVLGSAAVANQTAVRLEALFGAAEPAAAIGFATTMLFTVMAIAAMDLGLFIAHYLQHKVPLLWEFHKVHHSAEVLTPITVYRMHPVDDLLSGTLAGLLTGLVAGVFTYAFGDGAVPLTVFELNLFLFLFYVFGYNLRHSHVWLAYPRALSHVFVSPAQHQIHHSRAPKHFDRNMGFLLAIWDRLAGTLYLPQRRETLDFGLDRMEHEEFDSALRLYWLPFRKAAALISGTRREQA